MAKKTLILLCALALSISAAGCGKNNSSENDSTSSSQVTEEKGMKGTRLTAENAKQVGRTYLDDEGTLWCALSGSGVEFEFTGKNLDIIIESDKVTSTGPRDHYSRLAILVDGERVVDDMLNDGIKKYSPINELSDGALQAAEVISKLGGAPAVIFDKDHVVAVSGVPKKEYSQRRLSPALEELLQQRRSYEYTSAAQRAVYPVEGMNAHALAIAPIISGGDVSGAVAFVAEKENECVTVKQTLLAKTAALFLGKQIGD